MLLFFVTARLLIAQIGFNAAIAALIYFKSKRHSGRLSDLSPV
jgi:hypothetical protein